MSLVDVQVKSLFCKCACEDTFTFVSDFCAKLIFKGFSNVSVTYTAPFKPV